MCYSKTHFLYHFVLLSAMLHSCLPDLLRELAPSAEDDVISYLSAALAEAESREEVRDCCEAWLEDGEAGLERLYEALKLASGQAPSSARKLPREAWLTEKPKGSRHASPDPADNPGSQDIEPKATQNKTKPPKKSKAKADVSTPPLESLAEVTARVSRYHREAVEDEMTSALAEVDVHDLCISVAGRDLLVDAHLKLCTGQRYGFVGRNGSGKSTLFRSMASGKIPGYPARCVTLLVDQEDVGDERTAVDTVVLAHSELTELREEEESLSLVQSEPSPQNAIKAMQRHRHLMAKRKLFKATMYESKLSGLRGKAAREALLAAEAEEKKAAEALESQLDSDLTDESVSIEMKAVQLLAHVREQLQILFEGPGLQRHRLAAAHTTSQRWLAHASGFGQGFACKAKCFAIGWAHKSLGLACHSLAGKIPSLRWAEWSCFSGRFPWQRFPG